MNELLLYSITVLVPVPNVRDSCGHIRRCCRSRCIGWDLGIIVILIWFCLFRSRKNSRTSETGSSDPSLQVGRTGGIELSFRGVRYFDFEELSSATKNFSDQSLIGEGKFGEVYKGLLTDGVLVAIKKRPGLPCQDFIEENVKVCFNKMAIIGTLAILGMLVTRFWTLGIAGRVYSVPKVANRFTYSVIVLEAGRLFMWSLESD
ncbi:hypothetical protein Ancab_026463 [Ancistrocladus abbreviatus]